MANSNKRKNKSANSKRNIKQVFIDEKSEEIVEDNVIEEKENDKPSVDEIEVIPVSDPSGNDEDELQTEEISDEEPKVEVVGAEKVREADDEFLEVHEENTKKKRGIRMAIVAAALVFSLLLASFVGASLALWDTDKSYADLTRALFQKEVKAAQIDEETDTIGEDEALTEDAEESDAEVSEDIDATDDSKENKEEEIAADESSVETIDADAITEEISGVDTFVKAGTDDVITNVGDTTEVVKYVDPNQYYPLPFTAVDEGYFKDALFIGDSRMQGFGMWSGLPATYYTAVGFQVYKYDTTKVVQTENGKVPIFDAMPYDAFSKVYIKVGLNELGMKESNFEEKYAEVIAKIREREPRAIIYVHGLLPVTAEKSVTDATHNNDKIIERNEALKEFAISQQAYYLDAYTAFVGPDGCLPAEMTGDGIHLKSQYMTIWKNFLMQNAVMLTY